MCRMLECHGGGCRSSGTPMITALASSKYSSSGPLVDILDPVLCPGYAHSVELFACRGSYVLGKMRAGKELNWER